MNIISMAEANRLIECTLNSYNIKPHKNLSYGLIEGDSEGFTYLYTYGHMDVEKCQELKKGVFRLEFKCGVRQMKEFTPEEMM